MKQGGHFSNFINHYFLKDIYRLFQSSNIIIKFYQKKIVVLKTGKSQGE